MTKLEIRPNARYSNRKPNLLSALSVKQPSNTCDSRPQPPALSQRKLPF